jgi:HEXXH motif-containing protein
MQSELIVGAYRRVKFGPSRPYDAVTERVILDKLERAWRIIEEVGGTVAEVVRNNGRVIQLRRDDANPNFFTSASVNTHIGRIALINPHLDRISPEALATALVHEAIHSLLYRMEQDHPLLPTLDPSDKDTLVTSPWTNAPLHLHTYLHACCVWYGLVHFWQRSPSRGEALLAFAQAGFATGRVATTLEEHRPLLADGLFEVLWEFTTVCM